MRQTRDLFICHVVEDKVFTDRLNRELLDRGLSTWYNEAGVGENLREAIDQGLLTSRYGIVVLSKAFFMRKGKRRRWSEDELNGLVQKERGGEKVVLPVWYGVDETYIERFSPTLAGRVAARAEDGIPAVVTQLLRNAKRIPPKRRGTALASQYFADTEWVDVTDFEPRGLRVSVSYDCTPPALPAPCRRIYDEHIEKRRRAEEANTEYFFNGARYRVVSVAAFRRGVKDERGEASIRFGPSDYFNFLATSAAVDRPLQWADGSTQSLRQKYLSHIADRPEQVVDFLANSFGVNILVVGSDNCAVLVRRSEKMKVRPRMYNVSANEGLRRSDGHRLFDQSGRGDPTPRISVAAKRALSEELALPVNLATTRVRWTSLGLDTGGYQFGLLGYIRVPLASKEIIWNARHAKDRKLEWDRIYPVSFTPAAMCRFVREHEPWAKWGVRCIYQALLSECILHDRSCLPVEKAFDDLL